MKVVNWNKRFAERLCELCTANFKGKAGAIKNCALSVLRLNDDGIVFSLRSTTNTPKEKRFYSFKNDEYGLNFDLEVMLIVLSGDGDYKMAVSSLLQIMRDNIIIALADVFWRKEFSPNGVFKNVFSHLKHGFVAGEFDKLVKWDDYTDIDNTFHFACMSSAYKSHKMPIVFDSFYEIQEFLRAIKALFDAEQKAVLRKGQKRLSNVAK